jgi:hypothetical protein
MKLLKNPIILIWFSVSFILLIVGVILSIFVANSTFWAVIAILLSTLSSSIFFPIAVGYFYDNLKERESGDVIWQVFKDFSEGGIMRVYKDREVSGNPENAEVDLRRAFDNHVSGDIKLIGISLRVFFNQTGPFFQSILRLSSRSQLDESIKIKALVSHPTSYEVGCRAEIETPNMKEKLIQSDIMISVANMQHLNDQFSQPSVEYGFYCSAPYCTLVIFPEKCYFSPNILARSAPVRLPMIVFSEGSHGYKKLNEYFEYLWAKRETIDNFDSKTKV